MQNKRLKPIVGVIITLLLIPFVAMQITDEVKWDLVDFIIAGVLLLSVGLLIEFVLRKLNNRTYRVIVLVVIILLFLLLWIELAVGIFGSPIAGS